MKLVVVLYSGIESTLLLYKGIKNKIFAYFRANAWHINEGEGEGKIAVLSTKRWNHRSS